MRGINRANGTLMVGTCTLGGDVVGVPYSPQRQSKRRTSPLHPVIPRFIDPDLERRYCDQRLEFRLHLLRAAAFAGVLIWLLFTLLNSFTIRDPSLLLFLVRLAGIIYTATIFAATMFLKPGKWVGPVSFLALAVQVPLLTCVLAFMSPVSLPYFPPTAICMMLGALSFAVGLSFFESVAIALGTICALFIQRLPYGLNQAS